LPRRTRNSAAARSPGASQRCRGRSRRRNTATTSPDACFSSDSITPPQGSAAFQRTASACVENVSAPFWTTVARVANRRAAASLSFRSSAALHERTTSSGDCGREAPQPAATSAVSAIAAVRTADSLPRVDFDLTAEQREIQSLAREFADAEIEPHAAEWDRSHAFPRAVLAKLADLGLLAVCVPEEYGGAGADFLSYILVLEELSRADAGVGVTVAVHTSACTLPILRFGTDEQRARFVPPLARGEGIGCFALTEAGSGSDAGALTARATAVDGGWHVTGTKQWITNAAFGGTVLFFARTDPETRSARGVSAFVVDTADVEITRTEEKLGLNSSVTNDIAVDAVLDEDRLLGERDHGFRIAMATLDGGRIGIAAQAVGIARAGFEVARAYAQERQAFGQRIADFQAIQHKLANMSMEIDAARLLVYRAAWLKDNDRPHADAGAKAKLFASEMARRQTAEAIQVLGGYGYTKEFPVERYYRDAKVTEIYEGTSEIQRLVIARQILGERTRATAPDGSR
jgi:alkylation response protein AidB-like acyl-CoA dehydrogenase